jgi:small subunit ribosomal protein S16
VGAQPTNTARAILSHKGVLMRHHLNGGVLKGAFSEQEADAKFKKWLEEKEANIQSTAERNLRETEEARQARVNKEKQINEQRVAELRKKKEEAAKAEAKAAKEAETASEENEEEATTEEMKDSEEKNA